MASPSLIDVTVESISGLGDGFARHEGKPVYIPKSCAGDKLRVRIVHETREFLRGEIDSVITAGVTRQAAPCQHFDACGGCSMQQLTPEAYRAFKQSVLATALGYAGYALAPEITFLPAASRRRVELKTSFADGKLSFAYYAARTNDLVPIEQCLILSPALQKLLPLLATALSAWGDMRGIKTVSLTEADSGIDMLLTMNQSRIDSGDALSAIANSLDIARINVVFADGTLREYVQRKAVTMTLGKHQIPLAPQVFLQASATAQSIIVNAVSKAAHGAKNIVDLFCGIGTYSFPLCENAKIHAVENDQEMIAALQSEIRQLKLGKSLSAEKRDLFKNPLTAAELKRFDTAIVNPPRTGAKAQIEQLAKSSVNRIIMVSCNPATWGRDGRILKDAGFTLESFRGIDQFVYSPHVEIISVFKR